jgi:hypothetical protein
MILVGITGKAGAGKDTIADYLETGHGFIRLSFASTLKAMMAAAGMPEPARRENKELPVPGFGFTWREAAQRLGTEWGRGLDQDIWVKLVEQRLRTEFQGSRVVLSDVRFENEAAMIRHLGGILLHVVGRAADLGANAAHASEAGVKFSFSGGDRYIDNSGRLTDTICRVDRALWGTR